MYIHVCSHIFLDILADIFRHNQVYSGLILTYSCIFRTLCNPDIFRTPVYLEPRHIQNCNKFRMLTCSSTGIFKILMYSEPCYIHSEPCQTSTMESFQKQLTANIIFAITAFHVLKFMKKYMNFFNRGFGMVFQMVFLR